jgi:hypothetical protein
MTMVRGQFAQLMAPGLHATFVHWLDILQREEEYSHIFHIENSSMAFEDEAEFSGLPPMVEKPEGEAITYFDAVAGGVKRYLHFTYGMGVRSSWELYEDDQYNLIGQVPKAIARSAHFIKEQQSWNVFNLGFTTAVTTDGVSLFNNQHPLLGGPAATNIGPGLGNIISAAGTYPNRPATDLDLSLTGLQVAVNQYERLIDSQGMPGMIKPRHLVIPPPLKWVAREILGSAHKPFTSDNEINSILNEDLDFFISHYLTSDSAWFLVPDKANQTLKMFVRKALDEDFADDFDTRSIKQVSFMRFSVGATSWMGLWGSNGP